MSFFITKREQFQDHSLQRAVLKQASGFDGIFCFEAKGDSFSDLPSCVSRCLAKELVRDKGLDTQS